MQFQFNCLIVFSFFFFNRKIIFFRKIRSIVIKIFLFVMFVNNVQCKSFWIEMCCALKTMFFDVILFEIWLHFDILLNIFFFSKSIKELFFWKFWKFSFNEFEIDFELFFNKLFVKINVQFRIFNNSFFKLKNVFRIWIFVLFSTCVLIL